MSVENLWPMKNFLGSMLIFASVVAITVFIAFVKIPTENNDVFKMIVGVIVGSASTAIAVITGKDSGEVERIKTDNQKLIAANIALQGRVDHLEILVMRLQERVIDRLSMLADTQKSTAVSFDSQ